MEEPQKNTQETANPLPSPALPVASVTPEQTNIQPPEAAPVTSDPVPQAPEDVAPSTDTAQSITWKASEFHAHEKSASWYTMLALATIALAAILYLLTKSIFTLVVVVLGGIVLGAYSRRQPGELEYSLSRSGIRIGTKQYPYDDFRLLVVTPESPVPEATLIPTKRFMPPLSVRYAPDDEDKILSALAEHLPVEERRQDLIDSLMHHIRF
jgi:hypothetical protein